MKRYSRGTRLVLVILAAVLAMPLAQTALPVEGNGRSRTVTRTFNNPAVVTLSNSLDPANPISASLYPSAIAVRGLKGTIRDVNLRLNDVTHMDPSDVEVLLVGPTGQTAIVMANVGGTKDADAVTLRLDDEAAQRLPTANDITLSSGAYRPTNATASAIAFNAPAPSAGANAALSVFDGDNPNGTWRLFVQDEYAVDNKGAFAEGWELEIETKVKAKKKR